MAKREPGGRAGNGPDPARDVRPGSGRHRWVFDLLARAGCRVEGEENGVYSVALADGLADHLDRERIHLTFRKRLAGRNGVELAAPGSWLHDELLRYARTRGRYTEVYLPARADLNRDGLLANRRPGFSGVVECMERRYAMLILFTFRITVYSQAGEESVSSVLFDCERGKVVNRPLARRTLMGAFPAGSEEFAEAPAADLEAAFRASWEVLQDRVEEHIRTIEAETRPQVQREIATVEQYYRQLIEEEKRLMKSRLSRRAQDESRQKIDLLKLEWERRVKDEGERLRPQGVATLVAVARVRSPMERWRCRVGEGSGATERDVWLDLARGEAWGA